MKTAFRVDGGGGGLGFGHLGRTLGIAKALKKRGISTYFVSKDYSPGIEFLESRGEEVRPISNKLSLQKDLEESLSLIKDADIILADSYAFDSNYLENLGKEGAFVVTFDDKIEDFLPVDLVIGNAYGSESLYKGKLAKKTKLLVGPSYLPLREEFRSLPKPLLRPKIKDILVTMGGEDPLNVTKNIVESFKEYSEPLHLHILLGGAYAHLKSLETVARSPLHTYTFYQNIKDMLELYKKVDVAISSMSVTFWELAAFGMPVIGIETAENQKGISDYAKKHHLAHVIGWFDKATLSEINKALKSLENLNVRSAYSEHCQKAVDGKGADRIAESILERVLDLEIKTPDQDPESQDSKLMWVWRNDPLTRKMARNSKTFSFEEHKNWYKKATKDPDKNFLLIYMKKKPAAFVRFDFLEKGLAEISFFIKPELRGQRVGQLLLYLACQEGFKTCSLSKILASIKSTNIPSLKIFERVGFQFIKEEKGLREYILIP